MPSKKQRYNSRLGKVGNRTIIDIIHKHDSTATEEISKEIIEVWQDVVEAIVKKIVEHCFAEMKDLHINIREEMALELARITLILQEKIVEDRIQGRSLSSIDPIVERDECFSCNGVDRINNIAKIFADNYFLKLYKERWRPKSLTALAKEENPKKTVLVPKSVNRNHFIPKSFIRKYWSDGQFIYRNRKRKSDGSITKKKIPLGSWGYEEKLYSDYLEAYFDLIEGDAARPIEMILSGIPLNQPQRMALVGFIVIQYLRNPNHVHYLRSQMEPIVAASEGVDKSQDDTYMKILYESLYRENDLYDRLARPVLWSKWVMIRAQNPKFVLPDLSIVFGWYRNERYVFVPLTPKCCLIVLPVRVSTLRVVPYSIDASVDLVEKITNVLVSVSSKDFLSVEDQQDEFDKIDFDTTISQIFELLVTAHPETGRSEDHSGA